MTSITTPTTELLDAIEHAGKRADVIRQYRECIALWQGGVYINWRDINHAIMQKWSKAGLIWIKKQAWA